MKLLLSNLDPQATDDDLRELVGKYTKLEVARIVRESGDSSRAGAVLEFDEGTREALYEAQRRLNGLYWRNLSRSRLTCRHRYSKAAICACRGKP